MSNNKLDLSGFNRAIANTAIEASEVAQATEEIVRYKAEEHEVIMSTAKNTKRTSQELMEVIHNLNKLIDINDKQLDLLKDIFNNAEHSLEFENEIIEIIKKDKNHPLAKFLNNMGSSFAANVSSTYGMPILVNAFKVFLKSKGINL